MLTALVTPGVTVAAAVVVLSNQFEMMVQEPRYGFAQVKASVLVTAAAVAFVAAFFVTAIVAYFA